MRKKAIVYCDKQFGLDDGKTAVGLVRHSTLYDIVGVIDSSLSGKDAGEVLGIGYKNIPIFESLDTALGILHETPQFYIYGKATLEAHISLEERFLIIQAMNKGMSIVNGLHQFFSEDAEFALVASKRKVKIIDIRKSPALSRLHIFSGNISKVIIPVVAILGTDCASGKRTTAMELNKSLNQVNIKSVLVGTGQTSLMQGAEYGVSIDAIPSQFAVGEIEHSVLEAFINEGPDIILIEGQGAVSHEAFLSSIAILRGSLPDAVVLQHAPKRKERCDFPGLLVPSVDKEIGLIEVLSKAKVVAITLNHEGLSGDQVLSLSRDYEEGFQLPTLDILKEGCKKLVQVLCKEFPELNQKLIKRNLEKLSIPATS